MNTKENITYMDVNINVDIKIKDKNNISMFIIQDPDIFKKYKSIEKLTDLILIYIDIPEKNKYYTPWPMKSSSKKIKFFKGYGGEYLYFIVNRLKPFIQRRYNIRISAKRTYMVGASLGGLISTYALFEYPGHFGGGVFVSPSYWYKNFIYYLNKNNINMSKFKIYMDVSKDEGSGKITENKDMFSVCKEVKDIFLKKGLLEKNLVFKVYEDMPHNEVFFIDRMYKGITNLKNLENKT